MAIVSWEGSQWLLVASYVSLTKSTIQLESVYILALSFDHMNWHHNRV